MLIHSEIAKAVPVIPVRVSTKDLTWITENSGFDWLFDYEYRTPRVVTLKELIVMSEENDSDDWLNFVGSLQWGIDNGARIVFLPGESEVETGW